MDKLKFAIMGCGHIGRRHADIIFRHNEAELTALIDVREKLLLNLPEYNVPFFNTLEAFLHSGNDADVVTIATPNGLHAEHALQCLQANKHVVVEKPLTLTTVDAERVVNAANTLSRHVFVVVQNRYSAPCAWLKKMVDGNKLGRIFLVQLSCYWNRDARYYTKDSWHGTKHLDGGTLFTQFSHFIDMLYWIFGDITNIQAMLNNFNHNGLIQFEDCGVVSFDLVRGGMGSLNFSTCVFDKNMESSITVLAEKGSIKISGQYMNELGYCHIKDYSIAESSPLSISNSYGNYHNADANHAAVIQNVIDVIRGKARAIASVSEAVKMIDIIERIYGAAERNR